MRKILCTGLLVGAFSLSPVFAEKVDLKLKWEPGKRYIFENTSNSSAAMPFPGGQGGKMETKGKVTMQLQNDVSKHKEGVRVSNSFSAIKMRQEMQGIVMEFDSEDPSKQGGLIAGMLAPLKDAKFDIIYDADGNYVKTEGLENFKGAGQLGMGRAELEAMTQQSSQYLPEKPVAPGDTWEADVDLPMASMGQAKIRYQFKFEELVKEGGREVAKISITGKMRDAVEDGGEELLKIEAKKVSGTMFFDVGLGQIIEVTTSLDLELGLPGGLQPAEGAPGKMPMKTVTVQKLVSVKNIAGGGDTKGATEEKGNLTPEEKKARRKARKEQRKKAAEE